MDAKINTFIDQNTDSYIERLAEAVAIPSVSGDADYRPKVFEMGQWIMKQMDALNIKYETRHPGTQVLQGKELQLPPIILARYGTDPAKKTVLVYGHYDVQPALKEDGISLLNTGWNTNPWTLTEKDGKLYGRGSTDDKAPILGWLWTIEAHQKLGIEFPVNLVMCFEGMEESGSEGLDSVIVAESSKFFADVDVVCISDNYWLGTEKPCITYGLRGIVYFELAIKGPGKDLHSGGKICDNPVFGGTVHEPMTDLVAVMSKLVTPDGKIQIPGLYDYVAPVTGAEDAMYSGISFALSDIHNAVEAKNTIHDMEKQGAFYAPGAKTVIPAKVVGKFSIRLVPDMMPEQVSALVKAFVESEFSKLKSKNVCSIESGHGGKPWIADVNHVNAFLIQYNYQAAQRAIEKVFKVTPDYTREGGSIPVTVVFQESLGKSVLLLPMGRADDGAHSTNEKIDKINYIEGIKLLSTYLHEIAMVKD